MQVATKQFIISRRQFIQDDTTVIDLKHGWYLSYHNTMPVFYEPKKDILLIGICWQINPEKKSPEETIRTCDVQTILQEEETWCGRYILVIEGKVYLDAAGMLTVFYAKYGISNDTKLLNSLVHDTREDWNPDEVMFFYPAPYTPYKKIKRLLPSQIYVIESEEITFRDIFHISHHIDYDDEEKLMADFIELFSSSLKQLYRMFPDKQFLLALSSGYDSRTVLALAHKAGIPFDNWAGSGAL